MGSGQNIYLTDQDMGRLRNLVGERISSDDSDELRSLMDELDRAVVVTQEMIPPNVVTMNSRIRFKDMDSEKISEVTLVYPEHADAAKRRISVLAPVGSALIGLSVDDEIEWPLPNGRCRRLKILSVLYQPEAERDWHL